MSIKNNRNRGIYSGTCKSAKSSPMGISLGPSWLCWIHPKREGPEVLLQFASRDTERKSFSGGRERELQGEARPHGKAHLAVCYNQSADCTSFFSLSSPLSSCTPTHAPAHSGTHDNTQQGNSVHWLSFCLGL